MGRPRDSDRDLWREAMRGVRPLAARRAVAGEAPPAPPAAPPPAAKTGGLDRRSFERLKRGRMPIEGRLDLHGLTQAEAHRALSRFLARAAEDGLRQVLVITGKGSAGQGVLREAVPRWLAEEALRGRILATAPARPKDGGSGALYVLLRRARGR